MVSVPGIQAYEDPDSVEPNAEIKEGFENIPDTFSGLYFQADFILNKTEERKRRF